MKELHNPNQLRKYKNALKMENIFQNPELPFHMYIYQAGESLLFHHPLDRYIKFLAEGEFRVYTITPEGEQYVLFQGQRQDLLSQWHIGISNLHMLHADAVSPVITLELELDDCLQQLMNDNCFLRYLLDHVTNIHMEFAKSVFSHRDTVANRLVQYLKSQPNQSFTGVEDMALRLHCSRSQIQKALRWLTQEGTIKKVGKGQYQLTRKDQIT